MAITRDKIAALTQESAAQHELKARNNELGQILRLAPAAQIAEKAREEARREAKQSKEEEEKHLKEMAQ